MTRAERRGIAMFRPCCWLSFFGVFLGLIWSLCGDGWCRGCADGTKIDPTSTSVKVSGVLFTLVVALVGWRRRRTKASGFGHRLLWQSTPTGPVGSGRI